MFFFVISFSSSLNYLSMGSPSKNLHETYQKLQKKYSGRFPGDVLELPRDISVECPGTCPEQFREISEISERFFIFSVNISGNLWEDFWGMSWAFLENCREMSRTFSGNGQGQFQEISGKVPGNFRECFWEKQEMFMTISGKQTGDCSGYVRDNFREVSFF